MNLLGQMMPSNTPKQAPAPQNSSYPPEAYTQSQNTNSQPSSPNGILPLLLSMMGGGSQGQNPLMSILGQNNPLASMMKPQQKSSPEGEQKIPDEDIIL